MCMSVAYEVRKGFGRIRVKSLVTVTLESCKLANLLDTELGCFICVTFPVTFSLFFHFLSLSPSLSLHINKKKYSPVSPPSI